ncbi:MAG: YqgE/AlgH family protein [Phocaeicola sp.]
MDMRIFQVESAKPLPQKGDILISSPFLADHCFTRSVVLMVEHNGEGSMGIIMNKDFTTQMSLNELVPELEFAPHIPLYKGGPMSRDTVFFLHTLRELPGSFALGHGLYLNGDFEEVKRLILADNIDLTTFRFFSGYAGWDSGQLEKEIEESTWLVGTSKCESLLHDSVQQLWKELLVGMGGKYTIWAKYPLYPSLN